MTRNREATIETSVRLVVYGSYDHRDETTRVVGVSPTLTWKPGDTVGPATRLRYKDFGWVLRAPGPRARDPQSSLRALMRMVKDPDTLRELPKALDVEVSIGVIGLKERPSFRLSPSVLNWLSRTGAQVDVDVYDLSSEVA